MDHSVECLELGKEQILKVGGRIDFANSEELSEALKRAAARGPKVVIDLSQTESLDSDAIHTLLTGCRKARDEGIEISLSAASENVRRILRMSGLAPAFGLTPLISKVAENTPRYTPAEMRRQDWRITESVAFAEKDLMTALLEVVVAAAHEAEMDDESILDVQVATTEALTNSIKHGSPEGAQSKVRVRCMSCVRAFVVEVIDEGCGVDSEAMKHIDALGEQTSLGLRLMQNAVDELDFIHDESGGRVRMLKWRSYTDCG